MEANLRVYGADKVWRQLRREGFDVARCTVLPALMRAMGLEGIIRGKPIRTTVSDKAAPCPLDHVIIASSMPRRRTCYTGLRLHLRLDLDRLRLRRLRHRRLRPPHRRLAGEPDGSCQLRPGRSGNRALHDRRPVREAGSCTTAIEAGGGGGGLWGGGERGGGGEEGGGGGGGVVGVGGEGGGEGEGVGGR